MSPRGEKAVAQGAAANVEDAQISAIAVRSADRITNEVKPWLVSGAVICVATLITAGLVAKRWIAFLKDMIEQNSYLTQKPLWNEQQARDDGKNR